MWFIFTIFRAQNTVWISKEVKACMLIIISPLCTANCQNNVMMLLSFFSKVYYVSVNRMINFKKNNFVN